jgi:hypothetical protein
LTARRWNSARRCGSLSGPRRCGSGSPRATRGPRHQRACPSQATHPGLRAAGGRWPTVILGSIVKDECSSTLVRDRPFETTRIRDACIP